jgi:osmoprotectant transport system ATP-binding protein
MPLDEPPPAAAADMIRMENVDKTFDEGQTFAVHQLSLQVHPGELLALLGGSGSGKTTTLKMINRLVEPSGGTIHIDGVDTARLDPVQLRRGIGYVFQMIGLFPHLTVAQNVATVPRLLGWDKARTARRVDELLEMVGLEAGAYAQRYPSELSGGQRQRVGFARALAAGPKLMLMDEPFGALDPITRDALQVEFRNLQKQLHLTVVMVTHDMTEALLLADRIAVMQNGRLLRVGTPHELMTDPQDAYVAELLQTPRRQADRLEEIAEA